MQVLKFSFVLKINVLLSESEGGMTFPPVQGSAFIWINSETLQ